MADAVPMQNELSLEQNLQAALRAMGTDAMRDAAEDLGRHARARSGVAVHLRDHGLTSQGAGQIADALSVTSARELGRLGSFSLSFNAIGDAGAQSLAAVLPESLGELGLVGCALGDAGGEAVLDWAMRAHGLRLLCIENNALSGGLRAEFGALRNGGRSVAVFV